MRINSRPIKDLKYKAEEGIIPDKEYILRVRAVNAIGASDPSEISENVFAKDPDCKFIFSSTSFLMLKNIIVLFF